MSASNLKRTYGHGWRDPGSIIRPRAALAATSLLRFIRIVLRINLPAVIPTGNTTEPQPKLFGIQRLQSQIGHRFGGSTSSIKNFCNQLPIKKWQSSPEAGGKYLRQIMLGVILIFWRPANFIHVSNGTPRSAFSRKLRGKLRLFFGYVKAIKSIEKHKPVTSP